MSLTSYVDKIFDVSVISIDDSKDSVSTVVAIQ